jgi:deoxyribodipyrimidine photo-lyase
MNKPTLSIFWHRRDLRLHDNAGLHAALRGPHPVLPLFIFDRDILDKLPEQRDARVEFIHQALAELQQAYRERGSDLLVLYGRPTEIWAQLLQQYDLRTVYTNRDYEPYAQQRDAAVREMLSAQNIDFQTFKDHVIFQHDEVLKADGTPYTVFTPYSRRWLEKLSSRWVELPAEDGSGPQKQSFYLSAYPVERHTGQLWQTAPRFDMPTLGDMGFQPAGIPFPASVVARSLVRQYDKTRNFPAIAGTSRLGVHFRFGTISIREKARHAQALNATFLNELVWRDFYSQILGNFPHVATRAFRAQYEQVPWRDAPEDFEKWCAGKTGYPIVDAGMRELNQTGYMHNRVRMIAASFLTKHLLLDWRLGEAYFAQKLLDFDLASNSGGWQWAAGCGTDAAPYFRIFNPTEQAKKFDAEGKYIRRWVPEYGTPAYPKPMVEHVFARTRCLEAYKSALGSAG